MCLGELGQVSEVAVGGTALVVSCGRTVTVSLATLDDPVARGDWLVHHSGFALARLDQDEAREAQDLRDRTAGNGEGGRHVRHER